MIQLVEEDVLGKHPAVLKEMSQDFYESRSGFTLVELLVVMAILGILATVSLANFRTSQQKARDAQRKADLRQIANALEAYMNDHGGYPTEESGKIKACGCGTLACGWGADPREFCDSNNTVYMKEIPDDPAGSPHYCYKSGGSWFQLYAKLENANDPEAKLSVSCSGTTYNFGISSPNTTP
jgi:general secretion pathway protein G